MGYAVRGLLQWHCRLQPLHVAATEQYSEQLLVYHLLSGDSPADAPLTPGFLSESCFELYVCVGANLLCESQPLSVPLSERAAVFMAKSLGSSFSTLLDISMVCVAAAIKKQATSLLLSWACAEVWQCTT